MTVLIAGAGIAGLSLGLTLHQIGIPFRIYESVRAMRPLGVGINLQPNAVRELFELGLEAELLEIGVQTKSLGFYSKLGREIWTEARGRGAGYKWPQLSIHRGKLQMLLRDALLARAAPDVLLTGHRVTSYKPNGTLNMICGEQVRSEKGALVIAADGIHSAIRAQMQPDECPPKWGGAVLWRGVTRAKPFLSGADMILAGHDNQRVVAYPISKPDPATGQSDINWIAEKRFDPDTNWRKEDWNRPANLADFAPDFADWRFDWLDVPALFKGASQAFEYPMVDRDPVDTWSHDHVTLIGDAAHPTYPVGSNGASQAIIDARVLGANFLRHGTTPKALQAYEAEVRPRTSRVTIANRGNGPDAILQQVEELCGGAFEHIEDVVPASQLAEHAAQYKSLAGFGVEALNAQPSIISLNNSRGI